MASLAGKQALIFLLLLLYGILGFSWTGPADAFRWHCGQYFVIVIVSFFWIFVTYNLVQKTAQQKQVEKDKLNEAIQIDGNKGVTQEWFNEISSIFTTLLVSGITIIATSMVHAIVTAYPNSPEFNINTNGAKIWAYIANTFSHKTLYLFIWVFDVVFFWAVALPYSYIDWKKPALLMPFKIQPDYFVPWDDWIKCVKITIKNQFIALICLVIFWELFPLLSPDAFSPELPTMLETVISLLIFIPCTEIWFFSWHYFAHKNVWLYENVHYFHHEYTSPFALETLYVKPLEHILINLLSLVIGPFIMGSHITTWYIFMAGSIMKRVLVHSGYHFPAFFPPDIHDYHHSQDWDNFGVIGVLDAAFGTNEMFNAAYQSKISKRYFDVQYPIDMIIQKNNAKKNT
eukprot:46839_1